MIPDRPVHSSLGRWPHQTTEELACHDPSCAPPPVGTGGSRPGGIKSGYARNAAVSRSGYTRGETDPEHYAGILAPEKLRAKIASAYEAMPLNDPRSHAAYRELVGELQKQYDHLLASGISVEFVDYDPYPSSKEMVADVRNGSIKVMKTSVTGSHPFLSDAENDMFRAVHDVYGHAATGRGFDRHGERAAFISHAGMFRSKNSIRALFSETEGQNSVLIKTGDFPPQKVGLLPDELIFTEGVSLTASATVSSLYAVVKPKTVRQSVVAACYDASCRPPGSGGTGGSLPSGGGAKPNTINASSSPHYQKRTDQRPLSEDDARQLIIDNDATGRRILEKGVEVPVGKVIGVRANLNVKKTTGITVQTIHDGTDQQLARRTGLFGGEAIGYGAAVALTNVNFSVNQQARHKIATGQSNKFPMASVDGRKAKVGSDGFDGIEVRFNPMKQHLFVDPSGRPIKSAEFATVSGSSVFVRGKITYWDKESAPKAIGESAVEFSAAKTLFDSWYEFACRDAACAPPPTGTGGSLPAATQRMRTLKSLKMPDGGFTIATVGKPITSGFAVAIDGSDTLLSAGAAFGPRGGLTPELKKAMRAGVRNAVQAAVKLNIEGAKVAIGGWHNPKDGMIEINVSVVFPPTQAGRVQARRYAKANDQIAMYDLATFKKISTGGSGGQSRATDTSDSVDTT